MTLKAVYIGDAVIDPPFAIPAGIVTTMPDTCEFFSNNIHVGAVVPKTATPIPRLGNREPMFAQQSPTAFANAVGYTNPGIKEFLKEFAEVHSNKTIIESMTASSTKMFEYMAKNIIKPAKAVEVVLSCPHTKGYGTVGGFNNPDITYEVTEAVVKQTGLPVIVKLAPDPAKIKELALAAKKAGAKALSGVNTVRGRVIDDYTGKPILTNQFGGLSGEGVSGIGVECVSIMRKAVGPDMPIMGGLGIGSASIARQYKYAGANGFYVGTALRGMSTKKIDRFFRQFEQDLINGTDEAGKMVTKEWIMKYTPYKVVDSKLQGSDLNILTFDKGMDANPGQFVFAHLPRKGEKPLSIANDNPLVLAVRKVGDFTSRTYELDVGSEVMVRGPYGNGFDINHNYQVTLKELLEKKTDWKNQDILVAGGTGAAPIYSLAKKLDEFPSEEIMIFLGAKTRSELLFRDELAKHGKLIVSTDDGSEGLKEFVTDTLARYLAENPIKRNTYFYNCGPEKMMKKAVGIESAYAPKERISASIERYTSCGVGICGRCSARGLGRACVDGPVYTAVQLEASEDFGKFKREAHGIRVPI
jgi:dihydroorotate dehydrogenase subfamily 1